MATYTYGQEYFSPEMNVYPEMNVTIIYSMGPSMGNYPFHVSPNPQGSLVPLQPNFPQNAVVSEPISVQVQQPKQRKKTHMCQDFVALGSCKRGNTCRFAHVISQLDGNQSLASMLPLPTKMNQFYSLDDAEAVCTGEPVNIKNVFQSRPNRKQAKRALSRRERRKAKREATSLSKTQDDDDDFDFEPRKIVSLYSAADGDVDFEPRKIVSLYSAKFSRMNELANFGDPRKLSVSTTASGHTGDTDDCGLDRFIETDLSSLVTV